MTGETERIARLEVEMAYLKDAAGRIETKVDGLVAQANMGRGALWVFMAVGGVIVSIATWVIQHIRLDPT